MSTAVRAPEAVSVLGTALAGADHPTTGVTFRLLGDFDVRIGGVRWTPPSRKPRRLLAALLLEPRCHVAKERLVAAVWDGEPPRSATSAIQVYASQLRRALPGHALVCSGDGYLLDVDPYSVDLHRFRLLVTRAETRPAEQGAVMLREALELFRGEPLANIGSDHLRRDAEPVIMEEHLSAYERLAELELALGRSDRTVPELLRLTSLHPLRERLWELLIRCQSSLGRHRDAADTYARVRRVLHQELGVEPGAELRKAGRQADARAGHGRPRKGMMDMGRSAMPPVLREPERESGHEPAPGPGAFAPRAGGTGEPVPGSVRPSTEPTREPGDAGAAPLPGPDPDSSPELLSTGCHGPNMLPGDLTDFVGRGAELERARVLTADTPRGSVILAVTGMPGAGKTALATRIAHHAAAAYPDGQFYVDLHGHSDERDPLSPYEALDLLLRMAGEPGDLANADGAGNVALAAARWRALLGRRRVVLLLDDAADAAQIRPLLPGDSASLVVVTGRGPLAELDGAHPIRLGMLSTAEATALFTGVVPRDEAYGAVVARLCGNLPLAVRIAAARLRHQASQPAAELVRNLRGGTAFDELRLGSRSVARTFDASYRSLSRPARHAFRMLGLLPGQDTDLPATAALFGVPRERARRLLDGLVDRNLLEQHTRGRFRMHPLLRRYALLAAHRQDPGPERRAALGRLSEYYLRHARAALRLMVRPRPMAADDEAGRLFADRSAAARWLAAERVNLAAVAHGPAYALPPEQTQALARLLLGHVRGPGSPGPGGVERLPGGVERQVREEADLRRQRAVMGEGRGGFGQDSPQSVRP